MARKGASTRVVGFLVLCAGGLLLFVLVHVRSFFHLQSLHDASAPAVGEPTSTQLRARLELLTNAVKDTSAKLQALEAKDREAAATVVAGKRADAPPPPAEAANKPADARGASDRGASSKRQTGYPKGYSASSGFKGHPILTLSDEELRSGYAVSDLMAWYGEADGGGSCAGDFGNALVKRWRDTKKTYCAPTVPESEGGGGVRSEIDCYLVHQTRHHGNGDNLCVMRDVAVNLGLLGEDGRTRPVVQTYVDTQHAAQPYVKWPKGFVQATCSPDASLWRGDVMPGWNQDWTTGAVQPIQTILPGNTGASAGSGGGGGGGGNSVVCDEWVEHPVLVVQRDTFANFFHDSEDFVNAFLALAVLQWAPGDVQVLLTDLYPQGPFWPMWSDVFSRGEPALTAWALRNKYGHKRSDANPPGQYQVCFRQLAVGIYGPAAPITVASWDTPCSKTALVRAYSDYVIRGLGLQAQTHYAQPRPSTTVTVTYMARRASSEWPEKKFCSDTESFFLCRLWANWGVRRLGRMVSNDAEVVKALKGLEGKTFPNGAQVRVQDVDFNLLSFSQQVAVDLATDVMVGPHGAGLMHNIFMRDRAALIELFVDGSANNRHFHNLAAWFGRPYEGISISNPIDVPELLAAVETAVKKIDVNAY